MACPEFFNADPEASGNVSYARHGGFIEGAEMFDAVFFQMSGAEAKTTDLVRPMEGFHVTSKCVER